MLLHDLHEESVFLLVKKLFFYFEVHQYVPDFLVLSGSCNKDMNHSSAKTVKFLGYKFHVKCRKLQSHDLYLLKSPFITCNIFYLFFCQSRIFFSFCCQRCPELRGAIWKMPQVFLDASQSQKEPLLYLRDVFAPYDPSLRM